jgi:hypothetical protein
VRYTVLSAEAVSTPGLRLARLSTAPATHAERKQPMDDHRSISKTTERTVEDDSNNMGVADAWRQRDHRSNAGGRRQGRLGGRTGCVDGSGEGLHPRRRRDRGGSSVTPDGGGGSRDHADGRSRACHAARRVRRAPPAGRLLPHVVRRPARRGPVRGLHLLQRPGSRTLLPAFPRRHLRQFCEGSYQESVRYRDFMGWDVPWYSAQEIFRTNGRPTAQWSRLEAGRSDDLGTASG